MAVEATIVVEFGEDESNFAVVELDDELNIDSKGDVKTTFSATDTPWFLVHFNPEVLEIAAITYSSGRVTGGNLVERERTQQITFLGPDQGLAEDAEAEPETQQLTYLPSSPLTWEWKWDGNTPAITRVNRDLIASGNVPAIGSVTYEMAARAYQLHPPDLELGVDETYSILVVVHLREIEI